jgi:hypothetical protein
VSLFAVTIFPPSEEMYEVCVLCGLDCNVEFFISLWVNNHAVFKEFNFENVCVCAC